jgi:hypothetical protein
LYTELRDRFEVPPGGRLNRGDGLFDNGETG